MHIPSSSTVVPAGALVFWFVLLAVKHVVADFYLQTPWMAFGKDQRTGWFPPLLIHCLIHGALLTVLLVALRPHLWCLGLIDFAIHITIDRVKGIVISAGRITPAKRVFWPLLGIDQALHHLTGFALTLVIVANS